MMTFDSAKSVLKSQAAKSKPVVGQWKSSDMMMGLPPRAVVSPDGSQDLSREQSPKQSPDRPWDLQSKPPMPTAMPMLIKPAMTTTEDWAITMARLSLGLVMLPHALQKTFGFFGGKGLKASVEGMKNQAHIPKPISYYAAFAELFGSLGLITGLFSRLAALGIASTMLGAVFTVHKNQGFFMNWEGKKKGEGFEYHILALALAAVVIFKDGGAASVDSKLAENLNS